VAGPNASAVDPGAPPVPGAPRGSTEPPRDEYDEIRRGRVTYMPITSSYWDEQAAIDYHPTSSSFDYTDKIDYHPVP